MNKGIVSSGSVEATNAAVDILESGGNAFDAAVSAVFTSMISEFSLTGIGGGGAMMIQGPSLEPVLYDFFVDAPSSNIKKNLDFFDIEVNFGDSKQKFHIGKGSAAVPGTLLGLTTIHAKYGVLPLSIVLEPAIKLARSGSKINKQQAFIIKLLEPIFTHTKEGHQLFCPFNKLLVEGDIFVNDDLAAFLEEIQREGAKLLYSGDVAELINDTFGNDGLLNHDALSDYRVVPRKPIQTNFMNLSVYSNPAPSAGGTLIIFILKLLEKGKLGLEYNELINAMNITNKARFEICTDSDNEYQINRILDEKIFDNYLLQYKMHNKYINKNNFSGERGCTTHVSVIDKIGNTACVTTTNGEGCGYFVPGTGIMLNNMLGEEDLNPCGFHQCKKQRRLPTMLSPTIIMKDDVPFMILGSGGSNRIRSAIVQVIINIIYRGMNLKDAIEAPRIHLEGDILHHEPGIENVSEMAINKYYINPFKTQNLFFGGVNAVSLSECASDPRRGGSSFIIS